MEPVNAQPFDITCFHNVEQRPCSKFIDRRLLLLTAGAFMEHYYTITHTHRAIHECTFAFCIGPLLCSELSMPLM